MILLRTSLAGVSPDESLRILETGSDALLAKQLGPALLIEFFPQALCRGEFLLALAQCVNRADSDPTIKSILLAERADNPFVAIEGGVDELPTRDNQLAYWIDSLFQLQLALLSTGKFTVGIFSGEVSGTSLLLALSTDRRVGSTGAYLALPAPNEPILFGLLPFLLVAVFGVNVSQNMLSHHMEADEALRSGLLHKVVGQNGLFDEALRLAVDFSEERGGELPRRRFLHSGALKEQLELVLLPLRDELDI